MIEETMRETLTDIYRRERLSFLQYIRQTTPYAGPTDKAILDRVLELGNVESATLDGFGEFLNRNRITVPHVGAFPSPFTNYNFIAVRKLLPRLVEDEARGLASLERDVAALPPGDVRSWVEKLADSKRMHLTELEKMGQ